MHGIKAHGTHHTRHPTNSSFCAPSPYSLSQCLERACQQHIQLQVHTAYSCKCCCPPSYTRLTSSVYCLLVQKRLPTAYLDVLL